MGMLDRYKKKGGFQQLLTLIETSGKQKQEQFLGLIAQENPGWEKMLRSKLLSAEIIFAWPQEFLSEILSRLQPLTLAVALHSNSQEKNDEIMGCIPNATKRKILQIMAEKSPTPAETSTCLSKVVVEVRDLIKQGLVRLEKIDPNLVIPENIEDQLAQGIQLDTHLDTATSSDASTDLGQDSGEVSAASIFEPQLRFDKAAESAKEFSTDKGNHKEEIDFLKKKLNLLATENTQLKHEVNVLRGKIEQIKRIA